MKKLTTFAVMAVVAAALSVQNAAADITFDLSDVTYDAGAGLVLMLPGEVGIVEGVDFDFTLTPLNGSWSREVAIDITGPGGTTTGGSSSNPANPGPFDVDFGGDDSGDPLTFFGTSDVLNGTSADGDWTLTLIDTFNDGGDDGVFEAGSNITIRVNPIPEPASLGVIAALGLVGLVRRRR